VQPGGTNAAAARTAAEVSAAARKERIAELYAKHGLRRGPGRHFLLLEAKTSSSRGGHAATLEVIWRDTEDVNSCLCHHMPRWTCTTSFSCLHTPPPVRGGRAKLVPGGGVGRGRFGCQLLCLLCSRSVFAGPRAVEDTPRLSRQQCSPGCRAPVGLGMAPCYPSRYVSLPHVVQSRLMLSFYRHLWAMHDVIFWKLQGLVMPMLLLLLLLLLLCDIPCNIPSFVTDRSDRDRDGVRLEATGTGSGRGILRSSRTRRTRWRSWLSRRKRRRARGGAGQGPGGPGGGGQPGGCWQFLGMAAVLAPPSSQSAGSNQILSWAVRPGSGYSFSSGGLKLLSTGNSWLVQ